MRKKLNPDWVEGVKRAVWESPFVKLISLRIQELDWGEAQLAIEIENKHLQPFGVVHGGVYAALIDATAFWAVATQLEPNEGLTTTEMKLNFLAPKQQGRLIGKGKTIKIGRTLCLGEASIEDEEGRLIAHGSAGFMRLPDFSLKSSVQLPEKYIG